MAQGFFQEALDTDWCCPMAHGGQGKGGSKCFHVDSAYAALRTSSSSVFFNYGPPH